MKIVSSLILLSFCMEPATAQIPEPSLTRGATVDGVQYGLWGNPTTQPAPTLFVLASTIDETLGNPTYRQCGNELVKLGYMCVSIDLPCHGTQTRDGEPTGLNGWSFRVSKNDDFVAECNRRLSGVLDHLIRTGVTDAERVAACGTSRGGFLALHFAAYDRRVKCAAGFAPVTDLAALREFSDDQQHPLVTTLRLVHHADQLAGRPVWIVIGDRDDRVGTGNAFEFMNRLSEVAQEKNIPSQTELHIISEPRGHTTPAAYRLKPPAEWIHRQLTDRDSRP